MTDTLIDKARLLADSADKSGPYWQMYADVVFTLIVRLEAAEKVIGQYAKRGSVQVEVYEAWRAIRDASTTPEGTT